MSAEKKQMCVTEIKYIKRYNQINLTAKFMGTKVLKMKFILGEKKMFQQTDQ